ncbi:pentatricopeptide repeat-containing protein At1g31430 [Aristolochia californica]|uniref:pentatricopeptide repeat-containing protein At1g31430 n=1 Tax=Aristolochia californica TaxID=171875 RepID=UPI0035D53028
MLSPIRKPRIFTRLTKDKCLSLLENCSSLKELKQIQSQVFRAGLHHNKDALNRMMSFCTDPQFGCLTYAEKIFRNIQNPSLFIYNLLIKAFTKKGRMKSTLQLFDKLRWGGLSPDNFTFPFVLKAMGCLKLVSEGQKIHGFIVKRGMEFDAYVRNSLMDMYSELDCVEYQTKLFDEMPDRDLISWNVMISGFVKCGKFEEAIAVFLQMEKEGVGYDEATLVSTLSASSAIRDVELGKRIHHYMDEKLEFSIVLGNALLDMYSKCGYVSLARKFFEEMPMRNVISWTSMVSGYANCGQLDEARNLFERSPTRDVILWTAMINGYVQFSKFGEALDLFREMQIKGIKPDKYTVVSLLTVCAHLGALEQGKWIHEYIEDNISITDSFVGTALVDMYAKCGCIEKSLEVFSKMDRKDTASWAAIICGLAMNGETNKALNLFTEMTESGVKPDNITFIGILSACNHGGLVEDGRRYFDSMKRVYQIEPKLEHYGCFVDLLGRAGLLAEAEFLIEKIPNDEHALPLWVSLLGACRIHGNVEVGERLAKRLGDIKSCNSGMYTLMANIYAAAEKWEDVTKLRRKMKDLGVKKTPGCSSIVVNGIIHEFLVGDTSHPQSRGIYSLLSCIARSMDSEEELFDLTTLLFSADNSAETRTKNRWKTW